MINQISISTIKQKTLKDSEGWTGYLHSQESNPDVRDG